MVFGLRALAICIKVVSAHDSKCTCKLAVEEQGKGNVVCIYEQVCKPDG